MCSSLIGITKTTCMIECQIECQIRMLDRNVRVCNKYFVSIDLYLCHGGDHSKKVIWFALFVLFCLVCLFCFVLPCFDLFLLFVCLFFCLSVCLSVCLFVCLFVCIPSTSWFYHPNHSSDLNQVNSVMRQRTWGTRTL